MRGLSTVVNQRADPLAEGAWGQFEFARTTVKFVFRNETFEHAQRASVENTMAGLQRNGVSDWRGTEDNKHRKVGNQQKKRRRVYGEVKRPAGSLLRRLGGVGIPKIRL